MLSTLFHIPTRIALGGRSLPLFGWGLLLAAWAMAAAAMLAWTARRHGWRAALETLAVPAGIVAATLVWVMLRD